MTDRKFTERQTMDAGKIDNHFRQTINRYSGLFTVTIKQKLVRSGKAIRFKFSDVRVSLTSCLIRIS